MQISKSLMPVSAEDPASEEGGQKRKSETNQTDSEGEQGSISGFKIDIPYLFFVCLGNSLT